MGRHEQERGAPAPARRNHVTAQLALHGVVRVADLMADLGVTSVTVRRDLAEMEGEGLLRRVHGGAVPAVAASAPSADPPAAESPARTLAVIVPSLSYYWPSVIRGMERAAARYGARIALRGSSYEANDEVRILERLLAAEPISGILIAPNTDDPGSQEVLGWLSESPVPSVLVERDGVVLPAGTPLDAVATDHGTGAALAVRHLAALGHTRMGLVVSRHSPTSRRIVEGWRGAHRELGTRGNDVHELPDRTSDAYGQRLSGLLERARDAGLTALVVHSDPEAMALAEAAQAAGIAVPEQLSIIAYDDEVAHLFSPALTAVSPPRVEVGEAAVDAVMARIGAPGGAVRRTRLAPTLTARRSTAPPPS